MRNDFVDRVPQTRCPDYIAKAVPRRPQLETLREPSRPHSTGLSTSMNGPKVV